MKQQSGKFQTSIRTRVDQQAIAEAGGAQIAKLNEIFYRMQCSREIIILHWNKNLLLLVCKSMYIMALNGKNFNSTKTAILVFMSI